MSKKLKKAGKSTSNAEIQSVSKWGIWLLIGDGEFYLPFKEYPWFEKATIEEIYNFKLVHDKHLHWPAIDIDVDINALQSPHAYPLKYS